MKICIDAGHNYSGWNTGASGNGLREQDISFYIADKLRALCETAGIEVIMTRPTLKTNLGTSNATSLSARYNLANNSGADLFISLHCNSGGGTGTETLIYSLASESYNIANAVQTEVVDLLGTVNRGVKERSDLAVLKHTTMPAILVETAFIDNAEDATLLANNQADFARAVFNGICKYYGIESEDIDMEELNALKAQVEALQEKVNPMIYDYIDNNMPSWARPTVQKLIGKGYLTGDSEGKLNLDDNMLRILVINDRAGIYGE